MWAGTLHLIFGNTIIGLFEAYTLEKRYNDRKYSHTITKLVTANYFSAFIGMLVVIIISSSLKIDMNNPGNYEYLFQSILLFLMLSIGSIIIEAPFYKICLNENDWKTVFKISAEINLISIVMIVLFYLAFHVLTFR